MTEHSTKGGLTIGHSSSVTSNLEVVDPVSLEAHSVVTHPEFAHFFSSGPFSAFNQVSHCGHTVASIYWNSKYKDLTHQLQSIPEQEGSGVDRRRFFCTSCDQKTLAVLLFWILLSRMLI